MATVARAVEGVKVDNAELRRAIAVYASVVKKTLANVVREQARLMCRDMVDFSPPFEAKPTTGGQSVGKGFTLKAREKGRHAVSRDIRKIFAPIEQAHSGTMAQYGDLGAFNMWVNRKMQLPEPHYPEALFRQYRTSGGILSMYAWDFFKQYPHDRSERKAKFLTNVSIGQVKRIHEKERHPPHYRVNSGPNTTINYVNDWKVVEKYIKQVQQRVGKLKSGWWWTGKFLGKMKRADWISDQGTSTSILRPQLAGEKPGVLIGNSLGRAHSQGWHLFAVARNYRHFAIRRRLIEILKGEKNRGRLLEASQKLQGIDFTTTE